MVDDWLTAWLRRWGGRPWCRIYGKGRAEPDWRIIDLFVTPRRNADSRWPLWRGTCITWTSSIIALGQDFARAFLEEQCAKPASREHPVAVAGGRWSEGPRRRAVGASGPCALAEIIAHECGHTAQARRLGSLYPPIVGSVTLFGEGPHFWNHFENDASEQGLFGGLVNGSFAQPPE